MKTLFRPVSIRELELIADSNWMAFPTRLDWQPIFYPVLNQAYAEQIAKEWNTQDELSGYCGIVTEFAIDKDYFNQFDVKNVGGAIHNELWVPSEELANFNLHIIGKVKVVNVFFGTNFKLSENEIVQRELLKFKQ